MTPSRYTIRKARPKVERDKAWVVIDGATGRMVAGLGRLNQAQAQAKAEQLNTEEAAA